MALSRARNRSTRDTSYHWPGFVDAMAQLLLVITFLLSVFMIAQFLLAREVTGQDSALSQLRAQIASLTELLALEKSAKSELESTIAALNDDIKSSQEKSGQLQIMLDDLQKEGNKSGTELSNLRDSLAAEKKLSADALARLELLNQQIAALRRQISALNSALEASENRDRAAKAQIADLGRRLNAALAQRVQELARYRSEFFGRLRRILANRDDIRIVGDRFVFQSEVLFPKGSSDINDEGILAITALAGAIKELEGQIPEDIAWVLRVDGHTDIDPIRTAKFDSNWELSSARAIAVVKQLIAQGIPPKRLVAAGFGEFQPIEEGDSEDAKSKNRRIELKLTEK